MPVYQITGTNTNTYTSTGTNTGTNTGTDTPTATYYPTPTPTSYRIIGEGVFVKHNGIEQHLTSTFNVFTGDKIEVYSFLFTEDFRRLNVKNVTNIIAKSYNWGSISKNGIITVISKLNQSIKLIIPFGGGSYPYVYIIPKSLYTPTRTTTGTVTHTSTYTGTPTGTCTGTYTNTTTYRWTPTRDVTPTPTYHWTPTPSWTPSNTPENTPTITLPIVTYPQTLPYSGNYIVEEGMKDIIVQDDVVYIPSWLYPPYQEIVLHSNKGQYIYYFTGVCPDGAYVGMNTYLKKQEITTPTITITYPITNTHTWPCTPTPTITDTVTHTNTYTGTCTETYTNTHTWPWTPTPTITDTVTHTNTYTGTPTSTSTGTCTNTHTWPWTPTPTPTVPYPVTPTPRNTSTYDVQVTVEKTKESLFEKFLDILKSLFTVSSKKR